MFLEIISKDCIRLGITSWKIRAKIVKSLFLVIVDVCHGRERRTVFCVQLIKYQVIEPLG